MLVHLKEARRLGSWLEDSAPKKANEGVGAEIFSNAEI